MTAVPDVLVVGALFCLWATAILLFRRSTIAWLACALALASTKLLFFANHLITEILIIFFFALLMLGLVSAMKCGRRGWWPVIGIVLGLLTLTRPEYLYLAYCFMLIGLCVAVGLTWALLQPGGVQRALRNLQLRFRRRVTEAKLARLKRKRKFDVIDGGGDWVN